MKSESMIKEKTFEIEELLKSETLSPRQLTILLGAYSALVWIGEVREGEEFDPVKIALNGP